MLPPMLCPRTLLFLPLLIALSTPGMASSPTSRISLSRVAGMNGFGSVEVSGTRAVLRSKYSHFLFNAGSRKSYFNNTMIWLNAGITRHRETWTITQADLQNTINALLRPKQTLRGKPAHFVVIDPGHGGADSGAIGKRRVYEKKVVLDVARRVKKKLIASSVKVRLTRDWDIALNLGDRSRLATRWGADLFVSIHANAAANTSASGIETFVMTPAGFPSTTATLPDAKRYRGNANDSANMLLAYYLQRGLLTHTGAKDRGIKHARFGVLKNATCPAALVECGFVSNAAEEAKMIDAAYRDAIAEGIARGILTYVSRANAAN